MNPPKWVTLEQARAFHTAQIITSGGRDGLRDKGLLESALARPQQLYAYEAANLYALAAAYAFGIIKNHPFIDGNKRTGFVVMASFLRINKIALTASEVDVVVTIFKLAAGALSETVLTDWLLANTKKL